MVEGDKVVVVVETGDEVEAGTVVGLPNPPVLIIGAKVTRDTETEGAVLVPPPPPAPPPLIGVEEVKDNNATGLNVVVGAIDGWVAAILRCSGD